MRRSILPTALLICLAPALSAQDVGPRAMTTDDGLNMARVGGAIMSPDGEWVFYSKSYQILHGFS
jgi:hypothetical protein